MFPSCPLLFLSSWLDVVYVVHRDTMALKKKSKTCKHFEKHTHEGSCVKEKDENKEGKRQ